MQQIVASSASCHSAASWATQHSVKFPFLYFPKELFFAAENTSVVKILIVDLNFPGSYCSFVAQTFLDISDISIYRI